MDNAFTIRRHLSLGTRYLVPDNMFSGVVHEFTVIETTAPKFDFWSTNLLHVTTRIYKFFLMLFGCPAIRHKRRQ